MKKIYKPKGPAERLSYGYNWSPRNIGSEQIVDVDCTVHEGTVVIENCGVVDIPNARTGQGTMFTASGGAAGEMNKITITVTTDAAHILEAEVYLPIR